ncbi:MAG: hypothetical protein JWM74_498 [Myxococcaceae bacterium]|nr:hypothetical protein [Myxococcaceae bacterium]
MTSDRALLHEARRALGIDHLVLVVHDASFPSEADEDSGRGSPYSRGAARLYAWADALGFTGIQLGPQGETSEINPSPYDGTVFSKTVLSIALHPLAHDPAWAGLLDKAALDDVVRRRPLSRHRVHYRYAYSEHRALLRSAFDAFTSSCAARDRRALELADRLAVVRAREHAWLDHDARFEALAEAHFTDDWTEWREGTQPDPRAMELAVFRQLVVHAQHDDLRVRLGRIGLRLHGDLQIGIAWRDRWEREGLFLAGYLMGAPPSRTNPDGQPWGYPLLDPESADAAAFFRMRVSKMLREFDAMRVDHPHGHVCPWVYRANEDDPLRAVNEGARLFESPDLPDHPRLAAYAIARPEQLDRSVKRYADGWVKTLDDAQVDRYARRYDAMIACADENGRTSDDVACEVLSTSPYPLRRVMDRHGLGRFRVTQKAKPDDPTDGYRSDHAEPNDWVMIGNHDTAPIWLTVRGWRGDTKVASWCDYLDARLGPGAVDRQAVAADPIALVEPMFADLFASKARQVLVFFPDLLGGTEIYNRPGVVDPDNWMLRVDPDFEPLHRARVENGTALGMARAFATALRARAAAGGPSHDDLVARLDAIEPPRCKKPGAR